MMKYAKDHRIFGRLACERYGEAGQRLIRESTSAFVSAWVTLGLRDRHKLGAPCLRLRHALWAVTGPLGIALAAQFPANVGGVRSADGIVRGDRTKAELENYFRYCNVRVFRLCGMGAKRRTV
jgi:hypothetical protein